MNEEKTEGITLTIIPYLKGNHILKVFTLDAGLISLIARQKSEWASLSSPLTTFELVYKKTNSELHRLLDVKIIDVGLQLRQSYDHLMAAGGMAKALLTSQLPGKKAPKLYQLFQSYMAKLPLFSNPALLTASFQLKLLQHDGLINLSLRCSQCGNPASSLSQGDSRCKEHATTTPIAEWDTLFFLLGAQKFTDLQKIEASPSLLTQIDSLFLTINQH